MEKEHVINGKKSYFDVAIFQSYVKLPEGELEEYQRKMVTKIRSYYGIWSTDISILGLQQTGYQGGVHQQKLVDQPAVQRRWMVVSIKKLVEPFPRQTSGFIVDCTSVTLAGWANYG